MSTDGENRGKVTLVTLGPTGTCHERAAKEYMGFQGVEDFEIEFIGDFFDGLERIRGRDDAFLIQCSAHPKVHEVTERHWAEVFVVDTFIYPTKALAVLSRREVERPRSLGLVPATAGYIDRDDWEEIDRRPVEADRRRRVAGRSLRGGPDPPRASRAHPDELRLDREIGEIDTTWVVYGTQKRFQGEVIGIPSAELFRRESTLSSH